MDRLELLNLLPPLAYLRAIFAGTALQLTRDDIEPLAGRGAVGSKLLQAALLGVVEQGAVRAEAASGGGIDQASRIGFAHLEADAEFDIAERLTAQEPMHAIATVTPDERMDPKRGAFAQDLAQLLRG